MRVKLISKISAVCLAVLACVLLFGAGKTALAANPTTIDFQGKVVNSDGTNVTNGTYSFVFRIYNTASPSPATACSGDATCLFEETQSSVTVTNGTFQVELGSTCTGGLVAANTCTKSAAGGLNFNTNSALYLTLQFNGDSSGSHGGFMWPVIHLTSVPYAYYADNAGSLGGISSNNFVQFATGSLQADSSTNNSISVNKTGASGDILLLQANSKNALEVNNAGTTLLGQAGASGLNGTLTFNNAAGANTVSLSLQANPGSSYTLLLPTTGPTTSQCLQTDSTTANQLKFASCSGGSSSLATDYNSAATTGNTITLASTGGPLIVQDNSTPLTGSLFTVMGNACASSACKYLDVTSSQITTSTLAANTPGGVAYNSLTSVDTTGNVGEYTSIAMGSDGFARIAYYDVTNGDLKYAQCTNFACTTKNLTSIDTTGTVGAHPSIAMGSDGFARIAYYDTTNDDLKFAQCTNAGCTTHNITTVSSNGGTNNSMAMGSDGFARIAYYDDSAGKLTFAQCTNAACTTNNITIVDSTVGTGNGGISLALGSDGFGRIAYRDGSSADLKFAQCTNATCLSSNINYIDTGGNIIGVDSIAMGSDGFARILYDDNVLGIQFMQCTNAACTTHATNTIASGTPYASMTLGSDGFARIAYQGGASDLLYAQCTDISCSAKSSTTVDSNGNVGEGDSIIVGADGFYRISYYDQTNGDLKFSTRTTADSSAGYFISGASLGTASNYYGQIYAKAIDLGTFTVGADGSAMFKNLSNSSTAFQIQTSAGNSLLAVDTTGNGNITIGNATNPSTISFVGGATGSRPASPTKGTLYYDTTTNQLVQYNGTKWMSDKSTGTKIVAMGTATGCTGTSPVASANPDGADYVVTSCTDAATTINTALSSLPATGGTVYLEEGTYIINGTTSINVPDNVTLTGAGAGTVIKLMDSDTNGSSYGAIDNSDSTTATNITIQNLTIDGNKANQGTIPDFAAINFWWNGSVKNTRIENVTVQNSKHYGIMITGTGNTVTDTISDNNGYHGLLISGSNNSITNSIFYGNANNGIWDEGSYNTITGNVTYGNTTNGIQVAGGNDTISGNNTYNNGYGILVVSNSNDVSGNTVTSNSTYGIQISGSENSISSNKIYDTGGTSSNNGIYLSGAAVKNSITNNDITDDNGSSRCTFTCYAINLSTSSNTGNYISGNHMLGDGTTAASINDAASGNTYANQSKSEKGDAIFTNGIDSATAFQIQTAGGADTLLSADTSANKIVIGNATGTNTSTTLLVLDSATADPTTGFNGAMYYNTTSNTFRCYVNGAWQGCAGGGSSLASSYNAAATTGNTITLASAGGPVVIQDNSTPLTGSLFTVMGNACASSSCKYLDVSSTGIAVTGVTDTGSATFKGSNSLTAFQIQNSGGASNLLTADTTNMRLGVDATYAAMGTGFGTPTVTDAGSGSLTSGSQYYYKVTAIDSASGETTPSAEGTLGTGHTALNISWTAVASASGYKVYRSTASGSEVYLTTVLTNSFKDTGTITAGTSTPPAANTAYVSTNSSNSTLQLSIGGSGTPTGQVYVSGRIPSVNLGISNDGLSSPYSVFISGHYAYMASGGNNSLVIFDISNPAAPTKAATTTSGLSAPRYVYVSGRYAYVASGGNNSLVIFDISNPSTPSKVGSISSSSLNVPQYVAVSGRYAYVVSASNNNLVIFDVSNPANPSQIVSINNGLGSPNKIYIQGRYAYVADSSNGLVILDVSNPAAPTQVGSTLVGLSGPQSVFVVGRYAYVADAGNNSLVIFDISNPAAPLKVGSQTSGLNFPKSVYVQGRYAYVSNQTGNSFVTFDVSNPSLPAQLGSTTSGLNGAMSVYIQGRYAYIASYSNNSLVTFDIGGTYAQQLEAGGAEFGTLSVDSNSSFAGDANITGGLQVGQSLQTTGNLGVTGSSNMQGSVILSGGRNQMGPPTALTLGATGSGSLSGIYKYEVTAYDTYGNETTTSNEVTTGTLSSNQQALSWTAPTGATPAGYKIYRTAAGGGSGTEGFIGTSATTSYTDTGSVTSPGTSAPTIDSTGQLTVQGSILVKSSVNSSTAFQVQNAGGSMVLGVATSSTEANNYVGLGFASNVNGRLLFNNSAGTNTVTLQAQAVNPGSSFALSLPTALPGASNYCIVSSNLGILSFLPCGAGASATVTLSPEFVGAVMSGVGGTNTGTMTSDYCAGSSKFPSGINTSVCTVATDEHNYYSWTANAGNSYDIFVRWSVPQDFASFSSGSFNYWKTAAGDTVTMNVYSGSSTACATQSASGTTAAWGSQSITMTGCAPSAGGVMTLDIHLAVGTNSDFARIGEIALGYNRK